MDEVAKCPACQTVLRSDVLGGLCPRCVWLGAEETAEEGEATPLTGRGLLAVPGHDVQTEIARGGMGIVYRAEQAEPRRAVALKMLLPGSLSSVEMRERFRLEARAIASLDHPAILPVYQVGELDGLPYFTMKLAAGGTLAARRAEFAGDFRRIAELLIRLAGAVQFAHEHGVLHRDLKPGNVLFDDAGRAYVSDFGLAKVTGDAAADAGTTRSLSTLGTPAYLAPEVARHGAKDVTIGADIYGLGAILYELLAGRPPFEASGLAELLRQLSEESPARVMGAPRDLEVICLHCLEKDPARRYASASALAEDLQRWLDGRPIAARPASPAERLWRWARRNPALATVSLVLLLALLVGGVVLSLSNRRLVLAVTESRASESRARDSLFDARVSEARALQRTRQRGQRFESLAVIRQAAELRRAPGLRDEIAAALALPDLRELTNWAVQLPSFRSRIAFLPDFSGYFVPRPGGFQLCAAGSTNSLREYFCPNDATAPTGLIPSADGRHIVVVHPGGRAEIWRVGDAALLAEFSGMATNPAVVALHPDRAAALVCAPGAGVTMLDLESGRREPLALPAGEIAVLAIAPGGAHYGVVRGDSLEVWTTSPLKRVFSQRIYAPAGWLAWSADGRLMAAASRRDDDVVVIDPARKRVTARMSGHRDTPVAGVFHPEGHLLLTVGIDRMLRVWDAHTGDAVLVTPAGYALLGASADGRRIATLLNESTLAVLEWAPARAFREWRPLPGGGNSAGGLVVSGDDRLAFSDHDSGVRIWDVRAAAEVGRLDEPGAGRLAMHVGPDDRSFLLGRRGREFYRQSVELVAQPSGGPGKLQLGARETVLLPTNAILRRVAPDGTALLLDKGNGVELWKASNAVPVSRWIRTTRDCLADFDLVHRRLAAVNRTGGPVTVWNADTRERVARFDDRPGYDVRFSPDGRWLVEMGPREYRVWDTETWQLRATLPADLGAIFAGPAVFTARATLLATRHGAGDVSLWSLPDFRRLVTLRPPADLGFLSLAVATDGSRVWILGAGHRIFEWDLPELRREFARYGVDW